MLVKFLILFITILLLSGCKTNPPATPFLSPTGSVKVNLRITDSLLNSESKKIVLLENFSNIGCYPCPIVNGIIKQLTTEKYGRSKLAAVKFPTNFPAPNDIFYLAAKDICNNRMSYYNIFYAPTIIVDGILKPNALDSITVCNSIETRLVTDLNFSINVNKHLQGDFIIDITIAINNHLSFNLDDLIIHTAITETDLEFEHAPGSSGEKKFYDVIRLMLPSLNGLPFPELITNKELSFEFENIIKSGWNIEKLNAIVYIQNKSTKEIYQTGSTFR